MRIAAVAFTMCLLTSGTWAADSPTSLDAFSRIPVLEDGRKMPLDTYARQKLLQVSGRGKLGKRPAIEWLAELMFTPELATSNKIFRIDHPEVEEALGLSHEKRRRYSLDQFESSLDELTRLASGAAQVDPGQRDLVDNELLRIWQNVNDVLALSGSLKFAIPDEAFTALTPDVRAKLTVPPSGPLTFYDVYTHLDAVDDVLTSLQMKDAAEWNDEERALFEVFSLVHHRSRDHRGSPPAWIPVNAHGGKSWLGPWDSLSFAHQNQEIRAQVDLLLEMVSAYRGGQEAAFIDSVEQFSRLVVEGAGEDPELQSLELEVFYNRVDAFYRAELLYGLAFLFAFTGMVGSRSWPRWVAWLLVLAALVPHTWGMGVRMVIMGRPPVTNLYATFVFVAWVCVLLCLLIEFYQRDGLGLLGAGFCGLALLMVSARFGADGDTMGKVVAVLDSNFWLATHVVTITMGYAGCVVAGLMGHVYIVQAYFAPHDEKRLASTYRAMFGVLGFGLTFSFLGTMLGGVWADQSWGRFWGWDPKENGALLIVLWCAILFHAKLARVIGRLGMAAGCVLGVVVVLFAWLGVNLLGVGLHSYGFTSGLAVGLYGTAAAEVGFLLLAVPLAFRRRAR